MMMAEATTPMLLMKASTTSRSGRPELVANRTKDRTAAGTPTRREAAFGVRSSFSPTPAATTWMIEIKDVSPAMKKEAKKSTPKSAPPDIWAMTVGNVTKDREGPVIFISLIPTCCVCAMKPRVAKTPIPANSSKEELAKPATRPVPTRLERRRWR